MDGVERMNCYAEKTELWPIVGGKHNGLLAPWHPTDSMDHVVCFEPIAQHLTNVYVADIQSRTYRFVGVVPAR